MLLVYTLTQVYSYLMQIVQQPKELGASQAIGCEECPLRDGRGLEDGMGQCAVFNALEEVLQPRRGHSVSSNLEAAAILFQSSQDGIFTNEDIIGNIRLWGRGGTDPTIRGRINSAFDAIVSILGEDVVTRERIQKLYTYRVDHEDLTRACGILSGEIDLSSDRKTEAQETDLNIEPDDFIQKMAKFVLEDDGRPIEEGLNELKRLARQLAKQHRGINLEELVREARKIPISDRHIHAYSRDQSASVRNTRLSVIARM